MKYREAQPYNRILRADKMGEASLQCRQDKTGVCDNGKVIVEFISIFIYIMATMKSNI